MKKIISIIAAAAMILSVAGCSNNQNTSAATEESKTSTVESSSEEVQSSAAESVDLSNPEVTIELGDFDAMKELCNKIQNFEMIGKVVKITGISQKRATSCTIQEKNDKGEGIGYTYKIDGKTFPDDYPASDSTITITAEVCQEGIACYLKVLPENFKVEE